MGLLDKTEDPFATVFMTVNWNQSVWLWAILWPPYLQLPESKHGVKRADFITIGVCQISMVEDSEVGELRVYVKKWSIRTKEVNECLAYVFVIMPSKDIFLNVSFYVLHSISPFHLESPHSIHLAIEEDTRFLHEPDFLSLVDGPRWAF